MQRLQPGCRLRPGPRARPHPRPRRDRADLQRKAQLTSSNSSNEYTSKKAKAEKNDVVAKIHEEKWPDSMKRSRRYKLRQKKTN